MVKAQGKLINEFYNNEFPENCYSEVSNVSDSNWYGEDTLNLRGEEYYDLEIMGEIIKQDGSKAWSFEELFLEWVENRATITL